MVSGNSPDLTVRSAMKISTHFSSPILRQRHNTLPANYFECALQIKSYGDCTGYIVRNANRTRSSSTPHLSLFFAVIMYCTVLNHNTERFFFYPLVFFNMSNTHSRNIRRCRLINSVFHCQHPFPICLTVNNPTAICQSQALQCRRALCNVWSLRKQ